MSGRGWQRAPAKWRWRDFLTAEEAATLAKADKAKAAWQRLNRDRAAITNRAIQRAKFAARLPAPSDRRAPE